MPEEKVPLIQLDPEGKAPILSYNVPEPTSYNGTNLIELKYPKNHFKAEYTKLPESYEKIDDVDEDEVVSSLSSSVTSDAVKPFVSANLMELSGISIRSAKDKGMSAVGPKKTTLRTEAVIDEETFKKNIKAGKKLVGYKKQSGNTDYKYINIPKEAKPAIYIVEHYKLSNFLGNYGAGRIINSFSLLPGEKTKISVKTYKKTEQTKQESSSILDSYTEEKADEFQDSVHAENSSKENTERSFEYYADASASGNWGVVSAEVSAGVSGSTNSAREEFSKNVSTASKKQSSKSSAKRDIEINTSFEVKEEAGEETSIEREIENINVSKTLNFVFRQMNQEFISILHLTDVRIGFFNGFSESKIEVPLYELDSLLEQVIDKPLIRKKIKKDIQYTLSNIADYKGNIDSNLLDVKTYTEAGGAKSKFLRVNKDYTSIYEDPISGATFPVPGVILNVDKIVMRTDGVLVESLLGQANALDDYSTNLQTETVNGKILNNTLLELEVKKNEAALDIINNKDEVGASLFAKVYSEKVSENGHAVEDN